MDKQQFIQQLIAEGYTQLEAEDEWNKRQGAKQPSPVTAPFSQSSPSWLDIGNNLAALPPSAPVTQLAPQLPAGLANFSADPNYLGLANTSAPTSSVATPWESLLALNPIPAISESIRQLQPNAGPVQMPANAGIAERITEGAMDVVNMLPIMVPFNALNELPAALQRTELRDAQGNLVIQGAPDEEVESFNRDMDKYIVMYNKRAREGRRPALMPLNYDRRMSYDQYASEVTKDISNPDEKEKLYNAVRKMVSNRITSAGNLPPTQLPFGLQIDQRADSYIPGEGIAAPYVNPIMKIAAAAQGKEAENLLRHNPGLVESMEVPTGDTLQGLSSSAANLLAQSKDIARNFLNPNNTMPNEYNPANIDYTQYANTGFKRPVELFGYDPGKYGENINPILEGLNAATAMTAQFGGIHGVQKALKAPAERLVKNQAGNQALNPNYIAALEAIRKTKPSAELEGIRTNPSVGIEQTISSWLNKPYVTPKEAFFPETTPIKPPTTQFNPGIAVMTKAPKQAIPVAAPEAKPETASHLTPIKATAPVRPEGAILAYDRKTGEVSWVQPSAEQTARLGERVDRVYVDTSAKGTKLMSLPKDTTPEQFAEAKANKTTDIATTVYDNTGYILRKDKVVATYDPAKVTPEQVTALGQRIASGEKVQNLIDSGELAKPSQLHTVETKLEGNNRKAILKTETNPVTKETVYRVKDQVYETPEAAQKAVIGETIDQGNKYGKDVTVYKTTSPEGRVRFSAVWENDKGKLTKLTSDSLNKVTERIPIQLGLKPMGEGKWLAVDKEGTRTVYDANSAVEFTGDTQAFTNKYVTKLDGLVANANTKGIEVKIGIDEAGKQTFQLPGREPIKATVKGVEKGLKLIEQPLVKKPIRALPKAKAPKAPKAPAKAIAKKTIKEKALPKSEVEKAALAKRNALLGDKYKGKAPLTPEEAKAIPDYGIYKDKELGERTGYIKKTDAKGNSFIEAAEVDTVIKEKAKADTIKAVEEATKLAETEVPVKPKGKGRSVTLSMLGAGEAQAVWKAAGKVVRKAQRRFNRWREKFFGEKQGYKRIRNGLISSVKESTGMALAEYLPLPQKTIGLLMQYRKFIRDEKGANRAALVHNFHNQASGHLSYAHVKAGELVGRVTKALAPFGEKAQAELGKAMLTVRKLAEEHGDMLTFDRSAAIDQAVAELKLSKEANATIRELYSVLDKAWEYGRSASDILNTLLREKRIEKGEKAGEVKPFAYDPAYTPTGAIGIMTHTIGEWGKAEAYAKPNEIPELRQELQLHALNDAGVFGTKAKLLPNDTVKEIQQKVGESDISKENINEAVSKMSTVDSATSWATTIYRQLYDANKAALDSLTAKQKSGTKLTTPELLDLEAAKAVRDSLRKTGSSSLENLQASLRNQLTGIMNNAKLLGLKGTKYVNFVFEGAKNLSLKLPDGTTIQFSPEAWQKRLAQLDDIAEAAAGEKPISPAKLKAAVGNEALFQELASAYPEAKGSGVHDPFHIKEIASMEDVNMSDQRIYSQLMPRKGQVKLYGRGSLLQILSKAIMNEVAAEANAKTAVIWQKQVAPKLEGDVPLKQFAQRILQQHFGFSNGVDLALRKIRVGNTSVGEMTQAILDNVFTNLILSATFGMKNALQVAPVAMNTGAIPAMRGAYKYAVDSFNTFKKYRTTGKWEPEGMLRHADLVTPTDIEASFSNAPSAFINSMPPSFSEFLQNKGTAMEYLHRFYANFVPKGVKKVLLEMADKQSKTLAFYMIDEALRHKGNTSLSQAVEAQQQKLGDKFDLFDTATWSAEMTDLFNYHTDMGDLFNPAVGIHSASPRLPRTVSTGLFGLAQFGYHTLATATQNAFKLATDIKDLVQRNKPIEIDPATQIHVGNLMSKLMDDLYTTGEGKKPVTEAGIENIKNTYTYKFINNLEQYSLPVALKSLAGFAMVAGLGNALKRATAPVSLFLNSDNAVDWTTQLLRRTGQEMALDALKNDNAEKGVIANVLLQLTDVMEKGLIGKLTGYDMRGIMNESYFTTGAVATLFSNLMEYQKASSENDPAGTNRKLGALVRTILPSMSYRSFNLMRNYMEKEEQKYAATLGTDTPYQLPDKYKALKPLYNAMQAVGLSQPGKDIFRNKLTPKDMIVYNLLGLIPESEALARRAATKQYAESKALAYQRTELFKKLQQEGMTKGWTMNQVIEEYAKQTNAPLGQIRSTAIREMTEAEQLDTINMIRLIKKDPTNAARQLARKKIEDPPGYTKFWENVWRMSNNLTVEQKRQLAETYLREDFLGAEVKDSQGRTMKISPIILDMPKDIQRELIDLTKKK